MSQNYKNMPLEKRKQHADSLIRENPSRVPILIQNEKGTLQIKKKEYSVPKQFKVVHFTATLRKQVSLDPENALYLYVQNHLLKQDRFIAEVYDQYKCEDGFLYITVSDIPVLGSSE